MHFLLPPSFTPKHYLVHHLLDHLPGAVPTRTHHTERPGLLHTPCPLPRSRARQTSPRRTEAGSEGGVGQRRGPWGGMLGPIGRPPSSRFHPGPGLTLPRKCLR